MAKNTLPVAGPASGAGTGRRQVVGTLLTGTGVPGCLHPDGRR